MALKLMVVVVIMNVRRRMLIVLKTSKKLFQNWNGNNLRGKLNDINN